MFSKAFFATIIAAVTTSAYAQSGTANTCCNSLTTAGTAGLTSVLSLLGVQNLTSDLPIGLGCLNLPVVGGSTTGCTSGTATSAASCDSILGLTGIGLNCLPVVGGIASGLPVVGGLGTSLPIVGGL